MVVTKQYSCLRPNNLEDWDFTKSSILKVWSGPEKGMKEMELLVFASEKSLPWRHQDLIRGLLGMHFMGGVSFKGIRTFYSGFATVVKDN